MTSQLEAVHGAIAVLQRLSDAFNRRRQQLALTAGLTEQQWAVLEEIGSEGFMPSMFAKVRESTPAAVSKILRQLIDKDLVTAFVSSSDGRQRRYEYTPKGRETMARVRQARQRAIESIWLKLDAGKLQQFGEFAGELSQLLEEYHGQVGRELEQEVKGLERVRTSGRVRVA